MNPGLTPRKGDPEGIVFRETKTFEREVLLPLYEAAGWSSAGKPEELVRALENSDYVVSAWDAERLVGLGNALSDGYIVVYYPHLLVLPAYRDRGLGMALLVRMLDRYEGLHQQVVLADNEAAGFYEAAGFRRATGTTPMWIYEARDTHRLAP